MSFISTADLQAEFNNLDLCDQAWDEVLDICEERKIKHICVLGDLKQAMNPVDIRVIKWWFYAIKRAKKRGIVVLVILGNHDRVGQHSEADNWLAILRRAGAITYDRPAIYNTGEERLFILPYCGTGEAKRSARDFITKNSPDRERDILLFHHDVLGAKYNRQGSESDAKLGVSDLFSTRYRYCISGHIHFPQRIESREKIRGILQRTFVYYVGSPFSHDWGEVNQRKRYLVVHGRGITSVRSKIPGWYDPSVSGFESCTPHSWKGSRIRIRVSCDSSTDYGRALERARKDAERKYKGAIVYVQPIFKDRTSPEVGIKSSDSDERKIEEFVRQYGKDRRDGLRHEAVVKYLCKRLSKFSSGLRRDSAFEFTKAKGKNFGSYEKVKINFDETGIVVVQGINYDRSTNCSNGSGKTTIFQLLPVALFGRNFKDQKSDAWANRWRKGSATAVVVGKTVNGNTIRIKRGRRPPLLTLKVNGIDKSSGMKSNEKTGTQALIEQATGFTWSTLANAVYIDRSVANAFLSGTKKQRTEVLSRFQNLERFDKALKLVRDDIKDNESSLQRVRERMERIRGSIEEGRNSLSEMREIQHTQIDGAYKSYKKAKRELKVWVSTYGKQLKKHLANAETLEKIYNQRMKFESDAEQYKSKLQSEYDRLKDESEDWIKFRTNKECPTCHQEVEKNWIKEHSNKLAEELLKLDKKLMIAEKAVTKCKVRTQEADGAFSELQVKISKLEKDRNIKKAFIQTAKEQYQELASSKHGSSTIIGKAKDKLKEFKHKLEKLIHDKRKLKSKRAIYNFAAEAFSRDGIPAFLNRQLCPVLNHAAAYYSELFCDSDIGIRFEIEDGEFNPIIINARGGESIDDQSTGERALAGLIASFALREVAPKTNILILDEPGEGLDVPPARQFAQALQKLKSKFCTIYIATHNQAMLSELSGERTLVVKKKNKISKIVSGD